MCHTVTSGRTKTFFQDQSSDTSSGIAWNKGFHLGTGRTGGCRPVLGSLRLQGEFRLGEGPGPLDESQVVSETSGVRKLNPVQDRL
eukprot:5931013-Amphidinium_carterae.1